MKVILTQDVKGTGKKGDVINVAEGFARNFLFPKGMAREASSKNLQEIAKQKALDAKKKADELEKAQELKKHLDGLELGIAVKTGEGGRLFGSINNKDIGEVLEKKHRIVIDKRKIEIKNPIKNLGKHPITIKLHPEVTATINVNITATE